MQNDLLQIDLLESLATEAPTATELVEEWAPGEALKEAKVERETSRVLNVKLLGAVSRNGRVYSDRALEDAKRLYEGVQFFLDHPTDDELRRTKGVRSVRDLAGRVRNVRRAGQEVRGDLHLIPGGPHTDLVLNIAESMPELAGNSHRATGRVRTENGKQVVEGLAAVAAVEFVTAPATSKGLFESHQDPPDPSKEDDVKDLTLAQLKEQRPDLVKAITDAVAESQELTQLKEQVKGLKKENDDLKAQGAERDRKALIETKLAEAKLPERLVTDVFRELLGEAKDEKAIDALIEDRKALVEAAKPSGPRSTERDPDKGKKKDGEYTPIKEADFSKSGLQLIPA